MIMKEVLNSVPLESSDHLYLGTLQANIVMSLGSSTSISLHQRLIFTFTGWLVLFQWGSKSLQEL